MAKTDNIKYFEAVGRRKTSVARVRLFEEKVSSPNILVNNKPHTVYFPTAPLKKIAEEALKAARIEGAYRVSAKLSGGGIHSQAEALRHGISRAILKINPEERKSLKQLGFLKRDPRMKERRKFGLKKARKAPQWAKR
ncbi:MAG: 30S ribosomal protein S9 [bacterium]|nr:30S ribosomal protein S9 [bacterium]